MSAGAKIINDIRLGDNVMVSANAVVNKPFDKPNILLVGIPAVEKREQAPWYEKEDKKHHDRVKEIDARALQYGL